MPGGQAERRKGAIMYGPAVRRKVGAERANERSCINDGMDSPAFHGRNRSSD